MITELIKKRKVYFDGATGTVLQKMGLASGECPELWNIKYPDRITELHRSYLDAGCDIVKTNTFGINSEKFENWDMLIAAAIECAKKAVSGRKDKFIAFDMGPCGHLLEPLGDMPFERAIELFSQNVRAAYENGADLILIETMNDSLETKAAVLAAKENCPLPVFVTNVYDESGKLMTGADVRAMVAMLEGLRVDAIGINCSLGPDKMIPTVKELVKYSSLPVIVNPNAGLPDVKDGDTVYNINADDFSDIMKTISKMGVSLLGGCCGTSPDYIRKTVQKTANDSPEFKKKDFTLVSSYTHAVEISDDPVLIGERINPTGKPKFKDALRRGDIGYIVNEGLKQADAGVQMLDVNVGLPEIDERDMMCKTVRTLQSVCDLPLQLDSSDPQVLESAMRIYNGKPLINSVNGKKESMESVFPLIQKYGGSVIALTIDEGGIPDTAQGRADIAKKIVKKAAEYGIEKKDIIVDPLAMAVSSDQNSAKVTLDCVRLIREIGVKASLGVSNISFGLPNREVINSCFFANALTSGLNCAIMNPFSVGMMNVYRAHRVLAGNDTACAEYIASCADTEPVKQQAQSEKADLKFAVIKGLSEVAASCAEELLKTESGLDIINGKIIPALNEIGDSFEKKKAFLPQLLMSAEAATAAFEVIKKTLPKGSSSGRQFILATVKGDIHDIGKNIVKVMLESYGFEVIDLGRDVPPETVVETAAKTGCRLVGLSALMTTTVPSMEETVKQLKKRFPDCKVVAGGAVLTEEYAAMIGADKYAPDAMATVRYAEEYYSKQS